MGPHMNLTVRRSQLPSADLWKAACRQPKKTMEKKVKNITKSSLGDKIGRIHMQKQNLDKMGTKRVTALRNQKRPADASKASKKPFKKQKVV